MELARREAVDRSTRFMAEQSLQAVVKRGRAHRVQPARAVQQRRQPFVQARQQGGIGQIGNGGIVLACECGAPAQGQGDVAPRQNVEPVAADRLDQSHLDRGLVGARVGRRRQFDRAQPTAPGSADRGGRR